MKQAAEIFRVATPGRHEITLQLAEGELVASRIVGRAIHAGGLLGMPHVSVKYPARKSPAKQLDPALGKPDSPRRQPGRVAMRLLTYVS